jgi:hypothetical protein
MNLLRQIKTVLWSFVGLGRRQDMEDIPERGNPLFLILIAFVLVLVFLGTLAWIARTVVAASASASTSTWGLALQTIASAIRDANAA